MNIIRHIDGFVCASFEGVGAALDLYKSMPAEMQAEYIYSNVQNIAYPYYYVWTWDLLAPNPRDRSKDKVVIMTAVELEKFCQEYRRDKTAELLEHWDDQYFYVGIVSRDGIDYGIRTRLGMPTAPAHSDKLSMLFDHQHMKWLTICRVRQSGVRIAFMHYHERVAYKKFKFGLRKFNRMLSNKDKLTPKANKKLKAMARWVQRARSGKEKPIS